VDFINFHIAYLLTKHKCVIIPDFGAFIVFKIQNDKPKRGGSIPIPIKYYLTFDPEIIQDDGLLIHSIEKEKGVSYAEALHFVDEYVSNLVEDLRTGQTVQFPWIGKIHLSDDRKIVFTPAKNLSCNASICGLTHLNFPYLSEISESKSVKTQKKRTKRPIFYIILAGIILLSALLFIFLISKPLSKSLPSYPDTPKVSDTLKINPVKPLIGTDSTKSVHIDSEKKMVADSVKLPSKYYIIVVSSLRKEKEAEDLLKYFLAKGLDKSIIIRSGEKYQISIETFDNREKAITFLNIIKEDGENPLLRKAWILELKGQ
jgi:nucleoid DNA-binding protein